MYHCGPIVCVTLCLLHVAMGDDVTVTTSVGEIIGATSVNASAFNGTQLTYTTFLGIPFAKSTSGDRRFNKPVTKPPFTELFIAHTPGDACPQNVAGSTGTTTFSEDCLNLNIFLPGADVDATSQTAVMVYIYGGAYMEGCQDLYHSGTFAAMNDVILVTFNYRVNVFGFLASGDDNVPGNYGLWDQQMAIKWVHDNIAAFGGDVNRITIFGVSAGASSVIHQAMFEGNNGLFQRIIAESGSVICPWALQKNPRKYYSDVASATGCDSENQVDVMECLRDLSVDALLGLDRRLLSKFVPRVDGNFIEVPPNDVIGKTSTSAMEINTRLSQFDLLLGMVSGEGGLFYLFLPEGLGTLVALLGGNMTEGVSRDMFVAVTMIILSEYMDPTVDKDLVAAAITQEYLDWSDPDNLQNNRQRLHDSQGDFQIKAGIVATANAHSNSRAHGTGTDATTNAQLNSSAPGTGSLYFYEFDHRPSWSTLPEWFLGANHADEIGFVLGLYYFGPDPAYILPRSEIHLSRQLMRYWTNFGKTGNPNTAEIENTEQPNNPGNQDTSDLPTWPPYDSNQQTYIVFTDDVTSFPVRRRPAARGAHFFNEVFPRLTSHCQPSTCPPCTTDVSSGDHVTAIVVVSLMAAVVAVVYVQICVVQ